MSLESNVQTLTVSAPPVTYYACEITLSKTSIILGETVTVAGIFYYIYEAFAGVGVPGKKVELVVNGVVVSSTTTDANGNFKFTLTPTAIGSYTIKARAYI